MRTMWVFRLASLLVLFPLSALSQAVAPPSGCPLTFTKVDPSGPSVHIRNESGKTIVGLSFYAAVADATEHWKWFHWDFEDWRPLREFGWNKEIKQGASKTLSWNSTDLNFYHGGGGAIVLASALYEDGTTWDMPRNDVSCSIAWYNGHKKGFTKPIELPPLRVR